MKMTIKAKNGTFKYNTFLVCQFKLDHGIWCGGKTIDPRKHYKGIKAVQL